MIRGQAWWRWFSTSTGVNLLIVLFNVALIATMWNAVIGLVRAEREEAVRAALERNDNLALAFEHYVIRTIESADTAVRYLIREHARIGSKMDSRQLVAENTVDSSLFTGISLVDEHGNGLTTTAVLPGKVVRRVNVGDRDYFRVLRDRDSRDVLIGKPVQGRVLDHTVIPIARRVNKADGTFGGAAVAFIKPEKLTDVFSEATLRDLDTIALVGMDGIARARLKGGRVSFGEDVSKGQLFAELPKRPAGHYSASGFFDRVPKFFSYRILPQYQLISLVGSAEADVLAEFYLRRSQYFWAAGLTTIFIAVFGILLLLTLARQRQAAADMARNQARFLATFNQAAVGISHTGLDGRFLDVNDKLCNIVGYSRVELLTRTFADVTHPDDVAANDDARERMLADIGGSGSVELEKRYIRKDGSIVWCVLTISLVRGAAGHPEYFAAVVQDITDRKRVREIMAQMAAIVESSSDAIISRTLDGIILSWNSSAECILGWTAQEAIGRPVRIFTPPEDYGRLRAVTERVKRGETTGVIEVRRMRKDRTLFDAQLTFSPVRDEHGNVASLSIILRDITERKWAEAALRKLELEQRELALQAQAERARLAEAQAVAKIGSWETEFPGLGVTWSDETYRIFEVDPAHFKPTHAEFLKLVHVDDRAKVGAALTNSLTVSSSPCVIEHRILLPDGRVKVVEERWHVVRDDQGRPVRAIGTCQDISERKGAETALRESEERFRQMTEAIEEVYWLTDVIKNTVLYISPAYEAVWGRTRQSLYAETQSWLDAIHPEDRERVNAALHRQATGTYEEEYRIIRPDGTLRWIRARAFPVRDAGGVVYRVAGVAVDITEYQRAKVALEDYAERMRRLSQRLSEVEETERRNINRELHDRVGPNLVALKLNFQMMRSRLPKDLQGMVGTQIDDAQNILDETNKQLRNVMADLRPPALDDYGLVAALRTYIESYAVRTALSVTVLGKDIQPRPSFAVETALFRIAQEALNNVAKYAQARQVEVVIHATDQRIDLSIADDGKGFDVERAATKSSALGLKTMRERALAIGAFLRIESTRSGGTRVVVEVLRGTL